ncbi:MAG: PilZ domain-containing protein [Verrucomicrobiota bacterium]
MSARQIKGISPESQQVTLGARQSRLTLSHDTVVIHKGGIEFHSPTPFTAWTEMTVELQSPDNGKVHCAGVVIACSGSKHTGYHVSMVFTSMSKQAQARLTTMAYSAQG